MSSAAVRRALLSDASLEDGSLERLLEEQSEETTEAEEHVVLRIHPDKLHYPDEPLKTLLAALFLACSLVVTTVALIVTNQRVPEVPPLPDLILDHVVYIEEGLAVSEKIMLSAMLLAAGVTFAHTHRLIILRRVLFIMALMYFYRAITMQVLIPLQTLLSTCVQLTVLPKPDPRWTCPKYNGSLTAGGDSTDLSMQKNQP